jgi:hypothetical protein
MANRLAKETSPYLQQHKNNPVDWYPWGDEALARARKENLPILLSVGYSACHWCHVMEHESFEDPETARLMNERFVNIKVDREERPDLDQIYQNVAQVMTQGGGWPLTVFLTPELKPFFGGTYFPPEDRYGRPGFRRVLAALSDAFRNEPDKVAENARRLSEAIVSLESLPAAGARLPSWPALGEIARKLLVQVDWHHGGFGSAPKFPNPMGFSFLWRMGLAAGTPRAREASATTLAKMARGGIYDQLGGGFHRYSVDPSWSVPHFEKMLYDNGLLLRQYAETLLTDGLAPERFLTADQRELFLDVLAETVGWVRREMTSPEGAFYSAQDADSEGEEGKFFVWSLDELERELSPDEARAIALRYGVTREGNFEHSGKTVLFAELPIANVAGRLHLEPATARALLDGARAKLLAARSRRVAPGRDDKVLTAWNGLMISGLAWAAAALEEGGRREVAGQALGTARRAFEFLRGAVADGDRLFSTFQGGRPRFNAYLDDYAFLAMAALDLARWERTAEAGAARIADATRWIGVIRSRFADPSGPGYFFTSDDHEKLISRPKSIFDQAIPSGTAVALGCLAVLAELDPDGKGGEFASELERQLGALFPTVEKSPYGSGELANVALLYLMGPVLVAGEGAGALCRHPHLFRKPDAVAGGKFIVCHRRTCSLPFSREEAARDAVRKVTGARTDRP